MCSWLGKQKWIEDKAAFWPHKERAKMLRELLEERDISPKEKYIIVTPPYMRRFDMRKEYKPWLSDEQESETIKHPDHYNWHPLIECIDIIKYFSWCRGAAIKYIFRAGRKDPDKEIEDLQKAIECLQAEVRRLENE